MTPGGRAQSQLAVQRVYRATGYLPSVTLEGITTDLTHGVGPDLLAGTAASFAIVIPAIPESVTSVRIDLDRQVLPFVVDIATEIQPPLAVDVD